MPLCSIDQSSCCDEPELVSIVIPCYNAEPWISQAIESALSQTWPRVEIIVVDDGSTDGSLDVIKRFGERIRWESGPNCGGNIARNRLLQLSRGQWLQYLDADDYLMPEKVARQLECAEGGPRPDVIYSPVILEGSRVSNDMNEVTRGSGEPWIDYLRWGAFQTTGMLFRKDALCRVGGWKPSQPCCQEHELLLRLLKDGCRAAFSPDALSVYRVEDQGTVSRKDPLRVIRIRSDLLEEAAEHLSRDQTLDDGWRSAFFSSLMECARTAWRYDRELANRLAARARRTGGSWRASSDALPYPYRVACRLLGFQNAERIADVLRQTRGG